MKAGTGIRALSRTDRRRYTRYRAPIWRRALSGARGRTQAIIPDLLAGLGTMAALAMLPILAGVMCG